MGKELMGRTRDRVGMLRRFLVFQGKAWRYCARLLRKNRASDVAASLSFSTIFGLVPLAVVVLMVFQFMPGYEDMGERIRDFAYQQLHLSAIEYMPAGAEETEQLTDHLDAIVQNVIDGMDTGGVTILSLAFVIVAALSLLFKIERAFNNICHVTSRRNFLHRMVNYWAVMTLGPVLIGIGIYIMTRYLAVDVEPTRFTGLGWTALSYLMALVTFFMLYFVLPNTSVQIRAAVWGAAVAALVWMVSKWLFGLYITNLLPYYEIYGAIGLIPLSVIWIYVTWLIVLFGLQLSFTMQHLKTLDRADVEAASKKETYFVADDITVIGMVREIAEWFEEKRGAVSMEYICSKLELPAEFGELIAAKLVQAGILVRVSEPSPGYMPGGDPDDIQVDEIAEVLDSIGFGRHAAMQHGEMRRIRQSQKDVLSGLTLGDILERGKRDEWHEPREESS